MIYTFSIYVTQAALLARAESNLLLQSAGSSTDLEKWFGSLSRSALSLFEGISGGVDWNDLVVPLFRDTSPVVGVAFILYVAFGAIGMMNVVTGTFVQAAIERAEEIEEIHKIDKARRLFKSIDVDDSGCITLDEINAKLESPA